MVYRQCTGNLGSALREILLVAYQQREWAGACAYYEAGLAAFTELNEQRPVLIAVNCLGNVSLRAGKLDEAWRWYAEALPRRQASGDKYGVVHTLASIAGYWYLSGGVEKATCLASAVRSLSATLKLPLACPEQTRRVTSSIHRFLRQR